MSLPPSAALAGLAVALSLPAVAVFRRRVGDEVIDWPRLRRGLLGAWAILAVLVALVAVAGAPADLGLRIPSVGTLVDGLLFGFIAFAGSMIAVGLLARRLGGLAGDPATFVLFEQPIHRRLLFAVSSATVESVVLFGFVVEALLGLGSGAWLAGAVAAAALLVGRAGFGARNALQWLPGSVVLAAVAVATRSVLVVVAIRLVYDVIVVLSGDESDYAAPTRAE